MLIEDCIKALRENPGKSFCVRGQEHLRIFISTENRIRFTNISSGGSYHPPLGFDWQEVRRPVTWQEALQAFMDYKKIRCEPASKWTPRTYQRLRESNTHLIDNTGLPITATEIIEGKWFVE